MEEEFIRNQERLKPQEEKIEEERSKVNKFFNFYSLFYRIFSYNGDDYYRSTIYVELQCLLVIWKKLSMITMLLFLHQ